MKASEQACGANISLTHYLLREFQTWKDGTEGGGGEAPGSLKLCWPNYSLQSANVASWQPLKAVSGSP